MSRLLLGFAALFLFTDSTLALESEPFRCRSPRWYPVTPIDAAGNERLLDNYVNKILNKVDKKVSGLSCDKAGKVISQLERHLVSGVGDLLSGPVEDYAEMENNGIKKCDIKFECSSFMQDSVYQNDYFKLIDKNKRRQSQMTNEDLKKLDSLKLKMKEVCDPGSADDNRGPIKWFTGKILGIIQPSIKMCEVFVGTDKFSHFFDQGFDYFKAYKNLGVEKKRGLLGFLKTSVKKINERISKRKEGHIGSLKDVLDEKGVKDEESIFGAMTSHVKSYADLSSNLFGMKFWEDAYSKSKNPQAFFTCENGKIKRTNRNFQWCDYINPSWDEAINCFVPGSAKNKSHFENFMCDNLNKYSEIDKTIYKCPMDSEQYRGAEEALRNLLAQFGVKKGQDTYLDMLINKEPFTNKCRKKPIKHSPEKQSGSQ